MTQEITLEGRVALIEEFIIASSKIGQHVNFLNSSIFSGLEQSQKTQLENVKDVLKKIALTEDAIINEYERLLYREKYDDWKSGAKFIEEVAAEIRKTKGLTLKDHLHLVQGSEEYESARKVVLERRAIFEEERKKTIDYEAVFKIASHIAELKATSYVHLLQLAEEANLNSIVYNLDGGLGWLLNFAQMRPQTFARILEHVQSPNFLKFYQILQKYISRR